MSKTGKGLNNTPSSSMIEHKQTEEQIGEIEELYRNMVELSPDSIFNIDTKGVITSCNTSATRLLGYSKDEMVSKHFSRLGTLRLRDVPKYLKLFGSVLRGKVTEPLEVAFYRKDGTSRLVDVRINLLKAGGKTIIQTTARDITERRRAEEKVAHLNLVLRVIRNVNQLIAREKDRDRLLKGACDNLIETRGYYNAWIALLDESGKLVTHAEAGLGKDFLSMIERLKHGELTLCGQQALEQSEVTVIQDPPSTCTGCPLAKSYRGRGRMTVRLEYGGKVCGLLSASISIESITEAEERFLFEEVAGDIAFALHNIDLEEERKQAEEALRESEEKFRTFMETASDLMSMADKDGKFTYVNDSMVRTLGYSKEELIGMHLTQILAKEALEKDFKPNWGKFLANGEISLETTFLTKEGKEIYCEMKAVAVYDSDGNHVESRAVHHDITERKQMEEELVRLSNAISISPDGIAISDMEGKITYVNEATLKIYGTDDPKDLLGKSSFELIALEDREKAFAGMKEVMEKGCNKDKEYLIATKSGSKILSKMSTSLIKSKTGETRGFVGTFKDITERKRMEEQIKESLAEKELLLKEVHHRVKNNMQIVSSLLGLQAGGVEDNKTRELLEESQARIKSMALVYNQLYQSTDLASIGLKDYVSELINGLVKTYASASLRITAKIEGDNIPLGVDLATPCGLFINELIINSLKYAFPNGGSGEIIVSLHETAENEVEIVVSDNGIGIPANLDLANTNTLGLYLVTTLVENQLGGKLELDRSQGTEFRITFNKKQT